MTRDHPRTDESGLYETDFYSWTQEQAALIRSGRFDEVDLENIAEEIETLGRSEAAALKSSYRVLCMHLLKVSFQPEKMTASWEITIERERLNLTDILDENPGLKPRREALFAKAYALARKEAAIETDLSLNCFPMTSPFTIDQAEASAFWPAGVPHPRSNALRD